MKLSGSMELASNWLKWFILINNRDFFKLYIIYIYIYKNKYIDRERKREGERDIWTNEYS